MTPASPRSLAGLLAALACAAGSGCATPFARLDGVLVDSRPALPTEFGRVQVIKEGRGRDGAPKMPIAKGDALVTAVDGVAVLTLAAGYEVIIEPGSDVTIENPSIFVRIGKLIVKTVKAVKEKLTLNGQFASAGLEGTLVVYETTRDQTVQIAVLEGRVTVRSRTPGWDSVTYSAGETGTIRAGNPPSRMQRLDPATARAIRQRIETVENTAHPVVPDLRGQPESAARPALQVRGFVLGSVTRVLTREVPAGIIVRTRPAAGSVGRSGDRVSVQVADSTLVVPSLLGLSLNEAYRALAAAGFRSPDTTSQYQPNTRIGTVVGAAPSDGALVSARTRITLTVARNTPDPTPVVDSTRNGCTVPNLMNLIERRAITALATAKLRVGKISRSEVGNTVMQQSLPPGRKVPCGTVVDFTIGTIGE
jgi:beta-lactam-binding protein with PASTA domain